jgi:uncharacterized alkaline shock family protein YloU
MAREETALAVSEHVTTLQQDKGKTIIADSVVARIAALAAREVEGVHELISHNIGQTITGLARAVTRQAGKDTGIVVEVGEKEAAVDVRLTADYGVNLPATAAAVRNNIINRVESMTGLIVKEVNVAIMDLYFPGEDVERRVQ